MKQLIVMIILITNIIADDFVLENDATYEKELSNAPYFIGVSRTLGSGKGSYTYESQITYDDQSLDDIERTEDRDINSSVYTTYKFGRAVDGGLFALKYTDMKFDEANGWAFGGEIELIYSFIDLHDFELGLIYGGGISYAFVDNIRDLQGKEFYSIGFLLDANIGLETTLYEVVQLYITYGVNYSWLKSNSSIDSTTDGKYTELHDISGATYALTYGVNFFF